MVTKHAGTGGLVTSSTVTAQLLYEIQGLGYYNPDVVVAFDTIEVHDEGDDRVRVSGRGRAAGARRPRRWRSTTSAATATR